YIRLADMLSLIKNNRHKYHNIILDSIKDNLYRKERYQLDFALAIATCDADICMHDFANKIRSTDKFIVLEDHISCVLLDGISADTAIKATSNLQTIFQGQHFGEKLFISLVSSTDNNYDNDGYKMINSLLDVLEYSIFNNMDHEIVDYNQMENYK
ncbi:MAG: hypothetical protein ABFQ64_10640, partial [Campylobacterota bacterium]